MDNFFVNFNEEADINIVSFLKEKKKLTVKTKTYSDKLPEKIKNFRGNISIDDLITLFKEFSGKDGLMLYKSTRYVGYSSEYFAYLKPQNSILHSQPEFTAVCDEDDRYNMLSLSEYGHGYLVYITEAGVAYETEINTTISTTGSYMRGTVPETVFLKNIELSNWRKARLHPHKIVTVLNKNEVSEILKRINPYALDFVKTHPYYQATDLIVAPQIEQLCKAGYAFVEKLSEVLTAHDDVTATEQFSRLTQPGKNMKQIFKTSKAVYTALKECGSLATWDIYRKMNKQGKISADNIERLYIGNYSEKDLNDMSSCLNAEYEGKKIFTFDSLQKYLERIDMYEAIDRKEGLILLKDYLNMCRQLNVKPRIDGDSLKREHDVIARTFRQKRDEVRAEKMAGVCESNKRYDYSEHIYFGRCIRSYDDLIDEATQQHNCVASYADSIISGRCYIFVVRSISEPDKSLATVEITPNGEIRQKLLAYNRPIHNKALTEFIERLSKNFKEVRRTYVKKIA